MQRVEVAHRGLAGPLHELRAARFTEHERQLAHGVPHQPGHGRVELLLHHSGGAPGRLHRADAGRSTSTTRPRHAVRAPRHRHAPAGQHRPGGQLHGRRATQNVCTYDGRSSTDENAPTLTYSWNFGNGTGSGPLPNADLHLGEHLHGDADREGRVGRHERAGEQDGHDHRADGQRRAHSGDQPAVRAASLVCNFSGVGSADSNVGDTFTYRGTSVTPPCRRAPRPPRRTRSPQRAPTR